MTERELYKEIEFKKNLKMYLKVAGKYKWVFIFVIFLALLIEGERIFEKYLFKVILDKGADFIKGSLQDSFFIGILISVGIVFLILLLFKIFWAWVQIALINRIDAGMMNDIKKKFFNHIVHLDYNFHTTHKTGALIARLNRGTRAIESLSDFFIFNVAPLVLQITIIGFSLIFFDLSSAIVVFLTAAAFISFGFFISGIQKKSHIDANSAEDMEKANIADVFTNIDSIKYFGKEKTIKTRFANLADDTKNKQIKFWDYGKLFNSGSSLIVGIGTFFIIYFPLQKFLHGEISVGTLAFIYTVYLSIMGPLHGFVQGIRRFYISLGDFDDLFKYDKIKNQIEDKPNVKKLIIKKGEIEFNDVVFSYYNKRINTINKLNLKINENEKVALVGHSGCGKTTLVKLLYRFYDLNEGEIKIDGKNIKEFIQESLRGELSIVPQECILFDDTIYNNIAFSNPSASREQVMKAIKFAQLDKFVKELPLKDKTIVGERGVKLSGGERQRVSIARAILADKKVLVLDEATSSLDSETEYEIQKDLEKLMQGRTSIIIAHRLSTIMKADRIIVMDKGRIVQIGNHRELIKRDGLYKRLWNLQKGGYLRE